MKTVIVASKNPVKIAAAQQGFLSMFPGEQFTVEGLSVPSGVSDQPFSNPETLHGALNRARSAREQRPGADYWVGIEGGVAVEAVDDRSGEEMWAFAWVIVLDRNRIGKGRTGTFVLPQRIAELVQQGMELGDADDVVFGRTNSKQENGAVGLLTENVIDRTAYYVQALILALIPFKNSVLYPLTE
jgi:inosine/xanthosine triphosphatase